MYLMEFGLERAYVKRKGVINPKEWLTQPFLKTEFNYFMLEVGRYRTHQENGERDSSSITSQGNLEIGLS